MGAKIIVIWDKANMSADLSILIPARKEIFLQRTIQDILEHSRANTEIIAVLDGDWPDAPLSQHPKLTVIHYPESIGQRAGTNAAAKIATGKYVMKADAHCAFDEGFDAKLLESIKDHDDWTIVPVMRNLHAFNWKCEKGHNRYQSPSGPCTHKDTPDGPECGLPTERDVVWIPKTSPQSRSFCFDAEPHFQYFGQYTRRPEGRGDLTETMSLQGSCFMLTRERYFSLNICDEAIGSWGSQGIEVAVKTWLSGGRVMVDNRTWYAHMFRTQGGDFGFPYELSGRQVERAKATMRNLFFENKWPLQKYPLSWLLERFKPVPGWHDGGDKGALEKVMAAGAAWEVAHGRPVGRSTLVPTVEPVQPVEPEPVEPENVVDSAVSSTVSRGMIYYTDSQLDPLIAEPVRQQLKAIKQAHGLRLVSASLKRLEFGDKFIRFPSLKRGHLAMFKQILGALEHVKTDIVYFTEHDVIYHPSHFEFVPPTADRYYYNLNLWQVRPSDGHCIYYFCRKLSQMCCYTELAITHYRQKIAMVEANDGKYDAKIGFEPGTRSKRHGGVDDSICADWRSPYPNIDIRHGNTLSKSKWSPDDFRNPVNNKDWKEADGVPYWGPMAGRFDVFLKTLPIVPVP